MAHLEPESLPPDLEYQRRTLLQRFLYDLSWDMTLNKVDYGDDFIKSVAEEYKNADKKTNGLIALNTILPLIVLFYSIGIRPPIAVAGFKIESFSGLVELLLILSASTALALAANLSKQWSLHFIVEAYHEHKQIGKPLKAYFSDITHLPFKALNHIIFPKEPRFYRGIKRNPQYRVYYGAAIVIALILITHIAFYYVCLGAGIYYVYSVSDAHPLFRYTALAMCVAENVSALLILYVIFAKRVTYVGLTVDALAKAVTEIKTAPAKGEGAE